MLDHLRQRSADDWQEITAEHGKVKRSGEPNAPGIKPTDIGKVRGVSRATVYRHLGPGKE